MDTRGISRLWRDEPRSAAVAALLVVVASIVGWTAIARSARSFWKLTDTFSGRKIESPSRLYGRPLALRAGEPMTPARLAELLAIHGYVRTAEGGAPRAGQFREARAGGFELTRRDSPFAPAGPRSDRLQIGIEGDRIERLSEGGSVRTELELDPPLLATWLGAERRDRRPARLDDVNPDLIHAVLAAEDATFFDHGGLAYRGIVRAALVNLRAGEIRQGASTITQQLARLRYLDTRRTYARKLREAAVAKTLELRSTKAEILAAYLNEIYLGKSGDTDLIGMGAAAYALFGKNPERLELHEAALLAALIRSPGRYWPLTHPAEARQRRDRVLAQMTELGWITAGQSSRARSRPLDLAPQPAAEPSELGWFKRFAAEEARRRYGAAPLEERGLTLLSTIDLVDQARAGAAVREGLEAMGGKAAAGAGGAELQAALVSIDPMDGAIRAYIGGRDFSASPFDRAAQARRPAGSSFKPVVLAAALQSGASLADRFADTPMVVVLAKGEWRPRNFDRDYRGPVSVRETMEKSLNVPAARLALSTGLGRVARLAGRFGFADAEPVPALALGAIETSPVALAAAYSVFASGGARPVPHALDAVLDRAGAALDLEGGAELRPEPILDPQTAFLVHSTLAGAVARGTGAGVRRFGLKDPLAGKTGTSDDERDSWFAGYSVERTTVVWVGYDDNSPTGLPGSRGALPIWATFMAAVRPERGFHAPELPSGIVTARIDPESGLLATPECPEVREELFSTGRAPVEFCPLHAGGLVYASIDGSPGIESDTASVHTGEAGTITLSAAPAGGETDFAWADVIAVGGHVDDSGEPRIVIRRTPVARAAAPIPVLHREPDSGP